MCPKLNKLIMRYMKKLNETKIIDFETIHAAKEELAFCALHFFPNGDKVASKAEIIRVITVLEKRFNYIDAVGHSTPKRKKGATQILQVLIKDLRVMAGLDTGPKKIELGTSRKLVVHQ